MSKQSATLQGPVIGARIEGADARVGFGITSVFLVIFVFYSMQDSLTATGRIFTSTSLSQANVMTLIVFSMALVLCAANGTYSRLSGVGIGVIVFLPSLAVLGGAWAGDFSAALFFQSYLNFGIVVVLTILVASVLGDLHLQRKLLRYYVNGCVLVAGIGFLQVLGLVNFVSSRSALTFSGTLGAGTRLLRMTSLFNEPSAFAFFMCVGIMICYLTRRRAAMAGLVLAVLLSLSLVGYAFLFLLGAIVLVRSMRTIKGWAFLIAIVLLFVAAILFVPVAKAMYTVITQRILTGSFGWYRVNAPILAIQDVAPHPFRLLFGAGMGQILVVAQRLSFQEIASTTHIFYADVLVELGAVSLLVYLYMLYKVYRRNRILGILTAALAFLGIGYRSPRFALIVVVCTCLMHLPREDA